MIFSLLRREKIRDRPAVRGCCLECNTPPSSYLFSARSDGGSFVESFVGSFVGLIGSTKFATEFPTKGAANPEPLNTYSAGRRLDSTC